MNTNIRKSIYAYCRPVRPTEVPRMWRAQVRVTYSGFGGLVVSMLASGTQVRGIKPGRSRRIFRAKKSMPSFGGEVKSSVPYRSFAACKKPYNYRGSRNCSLNLIGYFSPIVPPLANRGLSLRLTWSASGDEGGTKSGVVQ
jgi:hypothetical protein